MVAKKKTGRMSPPDLIDVAKKLMQLEGRHVGLWDVVTSQFECMDGRITALETYRSDFTNRLAALETRKDVEEQRMELSLIHI